MDIITMARELGKLIQQDERYKRIDAAKKANDEDEKLQELIAKYKRTNSDVRKLYEKVVIQMNDTHPTVAVPELMHLLIDQEVMANPNMAEFNAAKAEVDGMMNFISTILYGSVNGEDPDTIEMQASCGGNCSGCSGCH